MHLLPTNNLSVIIKKGVDVHCLSSHSYVKTYGDPLKKTQLLRLETLQVPAYTASLKNSTHISEILSHVGEKTNVYKPLLSRV